MAAVDLADDDADLVVVGHGRVEILDVGDRGGLERGFLDHTGVMRCPRGGRGR